MSVTRLLIAAFICLLPHALHAQTPVASPAAGIAGRDKPSQERQAELEEADKLSASVVRLYATGKYKEALPPAQRALALREKILPDEDSRVGAALHNLVTLYFMLGDADKAEPLCERILVRRERGQPPTSQATMKVLFAYGCIASAKGKLRVGNGLTLSERINRILLQDAIAAAGLTPPANLEGVGARLSLPQPRYPGEAKSLRMQGGVFVVMDVDEAGKVTNAEPLACGSGLKLLAEAASEAARGATFSPISIAGQPIRRKAFAMYNFILR